MRAAFPSELRIPAGPSGLHGEWDLTVPGDKSISHRALMLGGLSPGRTQLSGVLESADCMATLAAMAQLGVRFERGAESGVYIVDGSGGRLTEPHSAIDCGNSGTAMRLLAGIMAGQTFPVTLDGDASLRGRPMQRIADPLALMGAKFEYSGSLGRAPFTVMGGGLNGIHYQSPTASAQVKSCVLLAGLYATGATAVTEPLLSRDHTERMLRQLGVAVETTGCTHRLLGTIDDLHPGAIEVPADISSAAFWMVAAAASPGCRLTLRGVGMNPTRTGLLDVLIRMGAQIEIGPVTAACEGGEPVADLVIRGGGLRGTAVHEDEIPRLVDEVPILAVAAVLAEGETRIDGAAELRVKESDRLSAMARGLVAMGAQIEELPDGLVIRGGRRLRGAELDAGHDHRIAMSLLMAGLFAEGETRMHGCAFIATSYPGFDLHLAQALERRK